MNKRILVFRLALALVLLVVLKPLTAHAADPDVIKNYVVTVTPQTDGTLNMKYDFDYCATTDFPGNAIYLEVGVPNKKFELTEWGPKDWVTNAYTKTSGGSWVHLDFVHQPVAGECFTFNFTIHQSAMAHVSGDDVTFQFIPGWFDFARIDKLTIVWAMPSDATLVKTLDPQSARSENGQAIWEALNLAPNQKFTVNLVIAKTAYPDLKTEDIVEEEPVPINGGAGVGIVTICLIIGVIIVVLALILWLSDSAGGGGGFSDGGYIGGYSGGSGSTHGDSGGGGSSGRNSGGGGNFGGRGSSCACVSSCACACACAGGGRAGCSAKGFDISWMKTLWRAKKGGSSEEKP